MKNQTLVLITFVVVSHCDTIPDFSGRLGVGSEDDFAIPQKVRLGP